MEGKKFFVLEKFVSVCHWVVYGCNKTVERNWQKMNAEDPKMHDVKREKSNKIETVRSREQNYHWRKRKVLTTESQNN